MNRHKAREKSFQILFQMDKNEMDISEAIQFVIEDEKQDPFLLSIVRGVMEHKEEIDQVIKEHLENWTLDRLAAVERTILRMATFEIKYLDDIPPNVSINEAVEIANQFGDEKSGKFVNGVLSKIIA